MTLINSNPNGQIFICPYRNIVHLEFGNLFIKLSFEELSLFTDYVNSIDYKFWLARNKNAQNRRKLLLHLKSKDTYLALDLVEFLELKNLLIPKTKPAKIKYKQIRIDNINLN